MYGLCYRNRTVKRLRQIRETLGWSQAQLAARASVRRATVSAIEGGKVSPRQGTLRRLADALGVPPARLLEAAAQPVALDAAELAAWVYRSGAIEGNTLSRGETERLLARGTLTPGKPLADHTSAAAHAKAVQHLLSLLARPLRVEDVHHLHRQLMVGEPIDVFAPHGLFKKEDNGTYRSDGGWHSYAPANEVRKLMGRVHEVLHPQFGADPGWLGVFVHATVAAIHPYADGNGRLARLLAALLCVSIASPAPPSPLTPPAPPPTWAHR